MFAVADIYRPPNETLVLERGQLLRRSWGCGCFRSKGLALRCRWRSLFAEGFFACPVAGFFCFGFFLTGERTGDSCEGLVTRRMPGGRVAAVEAEAAAPSDDAALKVTLECDGEVTLRDGDEIESRFLPVRANSLSSVDCDDMMEIGSWFRMVATMGLVRRRFMVLVFGVAVWLGDQHALKREMMRSRLRRACASSRVARLTRTLSAVPSGLWAVPWNHQVPWLFQR